MLVFAGKKIAGWLSLPFNPKFISAGKVISPPDLGELLKARFTSWGLNGKTLCALSGPGCLSQVISLPRLKGVNLSQVVTREARRLLSFNPETHYLYQHPLPSKGEKQEVFLLIVPKELVLSLLSTFQEAKVKLSFIEFKPLALLHCLTQPTAIMVHAEPSLAEIVIVVNHIPVLIRSLYLGEEVLSSQYVLERVISELEATIRCYRESHKERPLERQTPIYLCGSLSLDEGVKQGLQSATGHPLSELPCPVAVEGEIPLPLFMVNLGLFLGSR